MTNSFKKGDKVYLKSGGPLKRVASVNEKDKVECFWTDDKGYEHWSFVSAYDLILENA